MIDLGLLAFPFAAGLIAAFNPCGFAMLPTYLTYFLGLDNDKKNPPLVSLAQGLKAAGSLSLGFITVFGTFGLLFELLLTDGARGAIQSNLWIVTVASGLIVGILGIAMLKGFEPKVNLPKLNIGGKDSSILSMFLFGISYGVISLSCTLGPFLIAVSGSAASESGLGTIGAFVAYSLGMALIITTLTLFMALGKQTVATNFRKVIPYINKASGFLLVIASAYLVFYGFFQRDPLNNSFLGLEQVEKIQGATTNFITDTSAWWFFLAGITAITIFGLFQLKIKSKDQTSEPTSF